MAERLFTTEEAVTQLNIRGCKRVTKNSLATGRCRGDGPTYETDGRYVLYPESALDEWARLRRRTGLTSTSSKGKRPLILPSAAMEEDLGELDDCCYSERIFHEINRIEAQHEELDPF